MQLWNIEHVRGGTSNIIRKDNSLLFEHGTFPQNILITLYAYVFPELKSFQKLVMNEAKTF